MKIVLVNPPNFGSPYVNRDLMGGLGVKQHPQAKTGRALDVFLEGKVYPFARDVARLFSFGAS